MLARIGCRFGAPRSQERAEDLCGWIEADGGQHYEDAGRKRDKLRTQELNNLGVEILRFSDHDILTNIEGVFEVIQKAIEVKKGSSSV